MIEFNARRDRGASRGLNHHIIGVYARRRRARRLVFQVGRQINVKVIWIAPNRGELSIADDITVLYREQVSVSSKSEFGLGVGEIVAWQEAAIVFVDKLEQF